MGNAACGEGDGGGKTPRGTVGDQPEEVGSDTRPPPLPPIGTWDEEERKIGFYFQG